MSAASWSGMTTDRWEDPEYRDSFRVTFDEDPVAYDRSRPVAPAHVFTELFELARLGPGSAVLEIGPGTGQATVPLAERGCAVVALEMGPGLAARARQNLAGFPG